MRLVQVAKILGMTGQELRHELSQVNFGVKPTDREVPDGLAKGIIRFVAQKKGLNIDLESLVLSDVPDEEEGSEVPSAPSSAPAAAAPVAPAVPGQQSSKDVLPVLRKLTLEDVPREAIVRQARVLTRKTKAQIDAERREAREAAVAQRKKDAANATVHQEQIKRKEGPVAIPDSISVKEFAEKTGIQVPKIIQVLLKNGVMVTITQSIDYDTAAIVASELGVQVFREERSASAEQLISKNLKELLKDDPENLVARPPIVVVMGHVDHGKTALLDAIRHTNVVAGEHGGITQHIGAYQVEHEEKGVGKRLITFLDTPGHEAFTAMRARGAQITDIVILVVSAEEGVKATTVEAINHAKEAGVPIIVAVTKIDKERADIDRVKGEVAAHGLQPTEWGGEVPFIPCSAVTKQGISDILDHILIITELEEFKANPNHTAIATVIESNLDSSLGPLATVIVNTGALKIGDICVCGEATGKVKAMIDPNGKRVQEALPSSPVRVSGLSAVPVVGDILQVVPSEKEARALQESLARAAGERRNKNFADLVSRLSEGKLTQLKVVLKADAQGSLEAINLALSKLGAEDPENPTSVKVIHSAVGAVSESDVMIASASEGIVFAFHAAVPQEVQRAAEREGVKIREYVVLYELLDEVEKLLHGLIEPEEKEQILGHLEVKAVFFVKKSDQIIGGRVTDGLIKRVMFRLMRDGQMIDHGRIVSLKHVDKDIKEAKEGTECGMKIDIGTPVQEKDVLEVYTRELKRKED